MAQALIGFLDGDGNWVPVRAGAGLPTTGGGGEAPVTSVNAQTGDVVLSASDVNALPDTYAPPAPTWGSVTGKPSTFTPSAHTHTVAQVTGLQDIIDGLTSRIEALEAALTEPDPEPEV